jgi:anti-sigma factor RsiW
MTSKEQERADIEALLPWHAAGTLSRRDTQRVEAALADDPELAHRYELVREELGETIHLNETLGAPSARAMQRLMAAIEAEAPAPRTASFGLGARLAAFVGSFSPRTLAWSASAAAVVLLLQAAVITGILVQDRAGGPQLASHGDAAPTETGPTALVRFAPQASAEDITRFLNAYNATLVDGPRGGMFRIRVAGATTRDDLAKVVTQMQNEKAIVGFVGLAQ